MTGETNVVLVTGANGFVGRALCRALASQGRRFVPAVRRVDGNGADHVGSFCAVGTVDAGTNWSSALIDIDTVVHLAGRAHVMHEQSSDALAVYRAVNTLGTLNLARQAAASGVQRFVFVSSVKVNGGGAQAAYSERDTPDPVDSYGISKWEAEQGLHDLATSSGMEVVIVRPPLVYGPGVKANFLSMMRWINQGVPLPFGAVRNKRSLVALGNLTDFLSICIDHPAAANQTFLLSDEEDLSTTEFIVRMAAALRRPARLLPVPGWMLTAAASLAGKRDLSRRLLGSLQVDISKAKEILGWSPPVSVDEGLKLTADHYLSTLSRLSGEARN